MGLFKQYQWNNIQLQKKAKRYDSLMLIAGILVLASLGFLTDNNNLSNIVAMVFGVAGIVLWVLSDKTKTQDKKLKNAKQE